MQAERYARLIERSFSREWLAEYLEQRSTPKPRREPEAYKKNSTAALQPLQTKGGLEPYAMPLDRYTARHLLRRVQHGAPFQQVEALVGQSASVVVDALIDEALALGLPTLPEWHNEAPPRWQDDPDGVIAYFERNFQWFSDWMPVVHQDYFNGGLRERLTLFWHDHFATQYDVVEMTVYMRRYIDLLRTHALGNFKDFVHAMGIDAAMLIFLDGTLNTRIAPNENYARELLELFTMGIHGPDGSPNYTEADIVELARALTGWRVNDYDLTVNFTRAFHDRGEKTVLGRTEPFDYDTVIEWIFETRANEIAHFICGKLYRAFVYDAPNRDVVNGLAEVFLANNFEIAPVLRTLLSSAHFFEAAQMGARIKSPFDHVFGFLKETETPTTENSFLMAYYSTAVAGQMLFEPPNVAGWPGHRAWLSTATLPTRWDITDFILWGFDSVEPIDFTDLAARLVDRTDPEVAFRIPIALAQFFLTTPLEEIDFETVDNPFNGDLVANPLPDFVVHGPPYIATLAKRFLFGVPWYEWHLGHDQAPLFLRLFVSYLCSRPEFQLT
ncbi:MAG: hypothetical protein RhofKO_18290 [Rhodothermales bacterium]